MPVYVDPIMGHGGSATFRWKVSCHMFADTPAELHALAAAIGLKRAWFQTSRTGLPHYDLTVGKRRQAVAAGAISISGKACARKFAAVRVAYLREHGPRCTKCGLPLVDCRARLGLKGKGFRVTAEVCNGEQQQDDGGEA